MAIFLATLSVFWTVLSLLPFIQHQHWIFRASEFMRFQLLVLQILTAVPLFFFLSDHPNLWYIQGGQLAFDYIPLLHLHSIHKILESFKSVKVAW